MNMKRELHFLFICLLSLVPSVSHAGEFEDARARYDHAWANRQFSWASREFAEIVPALEKAVGEGYGDAAYMVAQIYRGGLAEPQYKSSLTEAEKYYLKAIELGAEQGRLELGDLYALQDFVNHDDVKAFRYWQDAMDVGESDASSRVAAAHYFGIGTPKNADEAYATAKGFFGEIAASRYPRALVMLGDFLLDPSTSDREGGAADPKEAALMYYYSGIPSAMLKGGKLMLSKQIENPRPRLLNNGGTYVPVLEVFDKVMKSNDMSVAPEGALLYAKESVRRAGPGSLQDHDRQSRQQYGVTAAEAMEWAAEQGNPEAIETIAVWYETGLNVAKNPVKARQWAEKSSAGRPVSPVPASCDSVDNDSIYTSPAHLPEFPGGGATLNQWIDANLRDPGTMSATVVVEFVVEKDGSVSNISIRSSDADPERDREARRLVRVMPKLKPATDEAGAPVRCRRSLKVKFRLMQG